MTTQPSISTRSRNTDFPTIGALLAIASKEPEPVNTLCQGMVYWTPPIEAINSLDKRLNTEDLTSFKKLHGYTLDYGNEDFREALRVKVATQNGLKRGEFDVIVTQGANQGFSSIVSCLCDAGDQAILFKPYYFNHIMAFQLSNVEPVLVECKPENGYLPKLEDIEDALSKNNKIKMIVVCNPCNPTGAVYTKELLDSISNLCKERGIWLVCDETYEYFMFEDAEHYTPQGDHILHLYSFSKAFGLAGWRVGYVVYPKSREDLELSLGKYQDTVPICCSSASQHVAMECLRVDGEDRTFTSEMISSLKENREIVWNAMQVVPNMIKTKGAIYYYSRLPNFKDGNATAEQECKVVTWLIKKHRIAILPGSCFGEPGSFRISFANLKPKECAIAAEALRRGLAELSSGEADVLTDL